jgi:DNA-binding Lrp family transcriptional regulator
LNALRRPDALDLQLIEALRADPQATNKSIAALVGASEATVASRIRAMADDQVMRVVAQRDIFAGGYTLMCFAWIDTVRRPVAGIARELAAIDEVTSVSVGIGSPELFANVRAVDRDHLAELLHARIGRLRGVGRVRTEICLHIEKFVSGFGDLSGPGHRERTDESSDRDARIVDALLEDGRMSNREIARRIGVSEGSVRQRLRKMDAAGQMRLAVVCDAARIGMGAVAVARIAGAPARMGALLAGLAAIDAVAFLATTTGEYNVVCVLQTTDHAELARICDDQIAMLPGVFEQRVHPLVDTVKHRYDLVRIA